MATPPNPTPTPGRPRAARGRLRWGPWRPRTPARAHSLSFSTSPLTRGRGGRPHASAPARPQAPHVPARKADPSPSPSFPQTPQTPRPTHHLPPRHGRGWWGGGGAARRAGEGRTEGEGRAGHGAEGASTRGVWPGGTPASALRGTEDPPPAGRQPARGPARGNPQPAPHPTPPPRGGTARGGAIDRQATLRQA